MTILINIYSCAKYNIYRGKIQVIASSILAVVCGAVDFDKIVDDKAYTSVPMPRKIAGDGAKKNIPRNYRGMPYISGGVRQFYGQLHTTTGNLQGNFAIFAIKTNFAPHAHGTFPDFHKIFPKQITGNLFQKTSFSLIF